MDSVTNLNELLNVNFAPNVSLQVCTCQLLVLFSITYTRYTWK